MARLPENPVGAELEDFVAAHFAARGVFVETGVTERDPKDILELDVVWTNYGEPKADRRPVEVKSGDWGLGDLFKYFGWTRYLGIDSGWFVCRRLPTRVDRAALDRLADRIGVTLCHIDDLSDVNDIFAPLGLREPATPVSPAIWRYSFWAQRLLLRSISLAISGDVCPEAGRAAKDYFKLINDATFFEPDVRARVNALLAAHWEHPRLAKTAASEITGNGADFEDPPDTQAFRAALYQGRHFPVQACLYLAHRARLATAKACIDYLLAEDRGDLPREFLEIFGRDMEIPGTPLHDAFLTAAGKLEQGDNFRLYAAFWQTFLWRWGGFILEDRLDEEYQALSDETGLPMDEIDHAFSTWDALFPHDGGWFSRPGNDCRRVLKLMPAAIRGIGAHSRLIHYGVNEYGELDLPGQTAERLAQDHNCAVRLLEADNAELTR